MPEKFNPIQKANAVLWYGICGNPKVVRRKFLAVYGRHEQHPEIPTDKEIQEWYRNFRHFGYVDAHDAEIHGEITGESMPIVENGHHTKFGDVVSHVLHKLNNWFLDGPQIRNFHPFHMELIEHDIEDLDERKSFAKNQLEHVHKWSHILQSMWFTGEAKFYTNGCVESNNLIYTNQRKPDTRANLPYKQTKHYKPSDKPHITVWAAMNADLLMGPFFLSGDLTPEIYKQTLEQFCTELHQITSGYDHPIFIHDDSKVHSYANVITYLEKEFPHRWIGKGSSYATWPHQSPDLNPINFFLWGYIKSRVYKHPIDPDDLDELKKRIRTAFANVTKELLEDSVEDYKTRLERVANTHGNLVDSTVYGKEIDYEQMKSWGRYAWPTI